MIKAPLYNDIAQSDVDFATFKALRANLSDYAGANMTWNTSTQKFDASGGGGGGGSGLDANTVVATDIGMVGDGVTDNTTALQAWLNSVETAKVSSTLLVPGGVYIFSGALQDGSRRNAQILLPSSLITDPAYSVTIKGCHPISYIPWPGSSVPSPKGAIFRSTLSSGSGTQPAFIGGMGSVGSPITPNVGFAGICFQDMVFQTVQNPQISCLNLGHYSMVQLLGDVIVMAGTGLGSPDMVQPTTTTSYGVILPPNSTGFIQRVENINVSNFYTGVLMGELAHISNIGVLFCYYSLEFPFAYHVTSIERIVDYWCKYGIKMTGAHTFQIEQFDVERANDGFWWMRVYDIDDASNLATADITWWTVLGGVGVYNAFTVNGGTGVKYRRAGSDFGGSPVYIGTDARMTAVSGGVKLEVRNTSTGVWVEATRYTNP